MRPPLQGTPLSIGSATGVYDVASRCEITRHFVDHPKLADVSLLLRSLIQALADEAEDEFWQGVLGQVRRLAFALCSTPLPFSHTAAALRIDWGKLHRQAHFCQQLYPDSHAALSNAIEKLECLSAEADAPFAAPLEALHRERNGFSVIIRNPRMHRAVEEYFAGMPTLRKAKVVSARQLRGRALCDVLVAIGPCGWFPEYVFSAPRASAIHVMSFRWIRDPWKPGPVFLNGTSKADDQSRKHRLGAMPRVGGESSGTDQPPSDLSALDLLPPLSAFARAGFLVAGSQSASEETVPARLCHLSGGRAVFIAADEGASSLIIDPSETGVAIVRRVPADELEPELYLLLRTSGGGDFIAPVAERILGASAADRRAQQAAWKNCLVSKARERFGALSRRELSSRISDDLRSKGLSQARSANVHYWMSSKCIRPRKQEDFAAVLAFAGLGNKAQDTWAAMGDIDRAHRRAGHLIRRMLLQTIAESSLEALERDGEMDFDLGEHDGGTLSAFQIVGVSEEEFDITADRIGVLLDLED